MMHSSLSYSQDKQNSGENGHESDGESPHPTPKKVHKAMFIPEGKQETPVKPSPRK